MSPAGVGVHLRAVTDANRAAVEAIRVSDEQSYYVADVADSLNEAAETPDARPWFRAVYDEDRPVGFVMISDGITVDNPDYLGPYYLWRLIIDHPRQGRGYGRAAVDLVMEHLRTSRPDATELLTSVVQGPASPIGFYLSVGFRPTGQVHQDEVVLSREIS